MISGKRRPLWPSSKSTRWRRCAVKKELHNCGGINGSSTCITLDAALIGATRNQEVAAVAPILIPAVLDLPVLLAIKLAISNQSDSMTSQELRGGVLVDTGLVCWEITVDSEGDIHGSILNQILHHVLLTSVAVDGSSTQLVRGERLAVSVLAAAWAAWRWILRGWARLVLLVCGDV